MNCLACKEPVTPYEPVIYLEYGRMVHVTEFVQWVQEEPGKTEFERLLKLLCKHERWQPITMGYQRRCMNCGKVEMVKK